MDFERAQKSEQQLRLEKLQSLNVKEKLVLFELAYRLGVTPRKETTTKFLTQLHPGHLAGLYEKWHQLDMRVSEQGTDIASLSDEEMETLLGAVMDGQE